MWRGGRQRPAPSNSKGDHRSAADIGWSIQPSTIPTISRRAAFQPRKKAEEFLALFKQIRRAKLARVVELDRLRYAERQDSIRNSAGGGEQSAGRGRARSKLERPCAGRGAG